MAVQTLTAFPSSLVAGDTLRVSLADSRYPSSAWSLMVSFQGATVTKTVVATAAAGNAFTIVLLAVDSALLVPPGLFSVSLIYTETATQERATDEDKYLITVFADPASQPEKSVARQTLEAMETALKTLAGGINATVNFNGQSFTKRNIPELQKAIEHQRAVVSAEERRQTGRSRFQRVLSKV